MLQIANHSPQSGSDVKSTNANRKRRRTNDTASNPTHKSLPPISDATMNPTQSPGQPLHFETSQPVFLNTPQDSNNSESQAFGQNTLSPSFSFSPWATNLSLAPGMLDTGQSQAQLDNFFSLPQTMDHQTPGGMSASGSAHTEGDKDPFMSLLEQLAENEQNHGGPSDLDFFLTSQS